MYEIFDQFSWTKENKTIPYSSHLVSGLGNFAHCSYSSSAAASPMHYHSDIIEIHCMIKGKKYAQIEQGGFLTEYTYTGNEAFITFPFEIHGNGTQPQAPCEFYAFQVNIANPDKMLGLNQEYSHLLCRTLTGLKEHRHLKLSPDSLHYLRTSFACFSKLEQPAIQIGVQQLTCFLFSLAGLTPVCNSQIASVNERIHQAILYLNRHLDEPMQLYELADAAGYSLSRFKVKFKEEVGITPAEYITLQKLEFAKKALENGDISITDLAHSLGFSSSNYFSSVFKKIMRCTPKDYRRQHHGRTHDA